MTQLLIVDDDNDFSGALRVMLQSRGFDVAMEAEPDAVLPRLDQTLPDALILDVMFPEDPFAGIKLAREIRTLYPELPILILTSVRGQFSLEEGGEDADPAKLPVTDFLDKPVDFDEFSNKLDRLLGRPTVYVRDDQ